MTKKVCIKIKDGIEYEATLKLIHSDQLQSLIFTGLNWKDIVFEADDFFDCQLKLRTFLESHKHRILIMGANENVYPSAMSRSMSKGLKAYILRLGKPAQRKDLINIFDYSIEKNVASVDKQIEFYKRWFQSIAPI